MTKFDFVFCHVYKYCYLYKKWVDLIHWSLASYLFTSKNNIDI